MPIRVPALAAVSFAMLALPAVADAPAQKACEKPDDLPVQPTHTEQARFREALDKYRDCMDSYIKGESALARQHNDAAQAAIAEFNDYVKQVNERYGNNQ